MFESSSFAARTNAAFAEDDLVILEDHKKRRSMITLRRDAMIHTHVGSIDASSVIGEFSGTVVRTSTDRRVALLRPTLEDFVLFMPRGAQVIYPKDLASIVFRLNLSPGARVLESGVGSGALSCALIQRGATVVGVEIREDHANLARKNVQAFLGADALTRYDVRIGDIASAAVDGPFDAVVLDLPEPWDALRAARDVLSSGGVLCVYVTNVTQLVRVSDGLREAGFGFAEAVELLEREWYLKGVVARPQHRMVGHTGFVLTARPIAKSEDGTDPSGAVGASD
ncbi:MAG: tRNA (adenine-N1)-methyltransferase [Acidimicrobiales bacterium]